MVLTVAVCATEDLSAAQKARISDLCNAANHTDAFRHLFVLYVPSGGRHFLGFDHDGVLASHAVVTTRWAQPGGHPPQRTAFVDAVATDPTRQHVGLSTEAMGRLGRELHDLLSDVCRPIYEGSTSALGGSCGAGRSLGGATASWCPRPTSRA